LNLTEKTIFSVIFGVTGNRQNKYFYMFKTTHLPPYVAIIPSAVDSQGSNDSGHGWAAAVTEQRVLLAAMLDT
jgi:hypothetical protein